MSDSKSFNPHNVPSLRIRYSREETLIGVLGIKCKLVGVRRHLVRLEIGIVSNNRRAMLKGANPHHTFELSARRWRQPSASKDHSPHLRQIRCHLGITAPFLLDGSMGKAFPQGFWEQTALPLQNFLPYWTRQLRKSLWDLLIASRMRRSPLSWCQSKNTD